MSMTEVDAHEVLVFDGGPCGKEFVVVLPGYKARRAGVLLVTPNGIVGMMVQSVKSPEKTYPAMFPPELVIGPYSPELLAETNARCEVIKAAFAPSVFEARSKAEAVVEAAKHFEAAGDKNLLN